MTTEVEALRELILGELKKSREPIQRLATRAHVSRSSLSQVVNRCGPYGTGKASLKRLEEKLRAAIERFECPYLAQRISMDDCRGYALRQPPTHNPAAMRHWGYCQSCIAKPCKQEKAA